MPLYQIAYLGWDASLKWPEANHSTKRQAHEGAKCGRSMVFQQPAYEIADPNNTRHHANADWHHNT